MSLLSPQVTAFIAVVEEMSFEGAARRLSVTPSAISQRIKSLEDRVGQLLIVRQTPCVPTPAGEMLLNKVKPMALLEAEAISEFLPDDVKGDKPASIAIAVNEDSLSTWLMPALSALYQTNGYLFDIRIDDQDYTLDALRRGAVLGALTSEEKAIQGCSAHFLGHMRYYAVASPKVAAQYFTGMNVVDAFKRAPMLVYNRKDPLQHRFIKNVTGEETVPDQIHYLPDSVQLVHAAMENMGWCMMAEGLFEEAVQANKLVNISPEYWMEDALYWQHAAIKSKVLSNVTQAFKQSAMAGLHWASAN